MQEFGLLNRINGLDHLPYWSSPPCNSIRASEGKFIYCLLVFGFPKLQIRHSR